MKKTATYTKKRHTYPAYKDSGIEWLGEIPEHWTVLAIKRTTSIPITDGPHETPEILDEGIPFISAEAIKEDKIDFSKMRGFISPEEHARFSKKYKPKRGDIYMIKSGATTGNVAFVDTDEEFNIWSPLAVIRPHPEKALTPFVFFFMKSRNFFQSIELGWSYGTQQNIGMNVIENLPIVLPPLPEQRAIASFLDRETARIDGLIEKKQRQIELLQEKRAALISHAVTKGLNPNAKMKDSGIEWLGEIPEHWEVKRLKNFIVALASGVSVNSYSEPVQDNEIGILKTSCVYGNVFRPCENKKVVPDEIHRTACPVKGNSLIISRMNTPELVASCGYVEKTIPTLFLPDRLWIASFQKQFQNSVKYFWYFIISKGVQDRTASLATGTSASMKNLTQEDFLDIQVAKLPVDEYFDIVAFLDRETERIDGLIEKVNESIALLREYRTALISAAVTGKIDVRVDKK